MQYNVKDFGALGNGLHDDKLAIQKAIDTAAANGGGTVYIPKGTYILSGNAKDAYGCIQLKNNVTVYGDGMGETILRLQDDWDKKVTGIVRTQTDIVNHDIVLRDLTIDGNRQNNSGETDGFFTGVEPGRPDADYNILVERVEIHSTSRFGFDPHEQTKNLIIRDSVAHHNGHSGFVADFQSEGMFENNISYANGSHGFNIVTSTHDFILRNNIAFDNGINGLVLQRGSEDRPLVDNILIEGGKYYGNGAEGILIKISTDVMVRDAEIYSNGTYGIRLMGADGVVVTGNHLYHNSQLQAGKYAELGIGQYDDTGGPTRQYYGSNDNLIALNTIEGGNAAYAILERDLNSQGNILSQNDITAGWRGEMSTITAYEESVASLGSDLQARLAGEWLSGLGLGSGTVTLHGTNGMDVLRGQTASEIIFGYGSDDTVKGGAGNDSVYGGDGHDAIYGSEDDDALYGDGGNDRLSGDDGNDYLEGGAGNDMLTGRLGNDILLGGEGDDKLIGSEGDDYLSGGTGLDFLWGGEGQDRFVITALTGMQSVRDFVKGEDLLDLTAFHFGDYQDFLDQVRLNGSLHKTLVTFDSGLRLEAYGIAFGQLEQADLLL